MVWRCLGLSGRSVLWQLLDEETLDLSLVKYHSLSEAAIAALAAQPQQRQQQQQQQQEEMVEKGLLLLKERVAAALQQLQQLQQSLAGGQRSVLFATNAKIRGLHLMEVMPFLECTYTSKPPLSLLLLLLLRRHRPLRLLLPFLLLLLQRLLLLRPLLLLQCPLLLLLLLLQMSPWRRYWDQVSPTAIPKVWRERIKWLAS